MYKQLIVGMAGLLAVGVAQAQGRLGIIGAFYQGVLQGQQRDLEMQRQQLEIERQKLELERMRNGLPPLSTPAAAPAYQPEAGRWEGAYSTGQQLTGDPSLINCLYRTYGGLAFSTIYRGYCPASVQFNAETSQVRR